MIFPETYHSEAKKYLAGGVNSPVRSFSSVGGAPPFIERAAGKYLTTRDGQTLLDFCLSWGPLILGHAPAPVLAAAQAAMERGTTYGIPTQGETDLARLVCDCVPSIDRVRFVNSGTEATMSALRLARAFTGREKLIKFDGCYHGHSDVFLVNAGSGVSHLPSASSSGVPADSIRHTISVPYNDPAAVQAAIRQWGDSVAAVIVEPVAGNMGLVPPEKGFLEQLRDLCDRHGILLIFDEVITGFRLGLGGAQAFFGVTPDLTTLGKIIGGGFPVGAFGGRADVMALLAPDGPVYQAGTLSGNPVAMAAGKATIEWLKEHQEVYPKMAALVERFAVGISAKTAMTVNRAGGMFTIFATNQPVRSAADARRQDVGRFQRQYHEWLEAGIYMPPSMFETAFISTCHTEKDLAALMDATRPW
ncbi:MAG: glutamate-1-semialdehyde 2,1-aminomutase [Lentisphaeria bacterium]|nr:glutamate-1-semialdehyde 2,1-aminomutase [Lentisphaeria bacterium]